MGSKKYKEEGYQVEFIEKLHGWSHAFGAVLGLAGFAVLIYLVDDPRPYLIPSLIVYSLALIFLFSASTFYHLVSGEKLKSRLRVVDHIGIYLLIAGSYTPVCAILLNGSKGWIILTTVWAIALFGTILKLAYPQRYHKLALILYLVMGWLIALDFSYLLANTSTTGIWLLGLGGAAYTIGIVFYIIKKIPFNHLIWHVFVLLGAISHWFFIATDVVS